MTKPTIADNFFGSCITRREKGVCDPELGNDFWELMSQFSSANHNSILIFVEITRVGFAWGSWLQWPAVFKLEGQVFKLEGVIYYVDPKSVGSMSFLGVKERIQIPINSKHSSHEALKRHIIEYTGLKS